MLALPTPLESQIVDLANRCGMSVDTYLDGLINKAKASAFEVVVTCQDGIWTGECDALGLVTESDTYDGLVARACLIAPELAELNGVTADADNLNLSFSHQQKVSVLAY